MNVSESIRFANISATTAPFALQGGKYGVFVNGTWGGGSAALQGLMADGTTYFTVLTAFTADGYAAVDLAPGQYKITIVTASGVYASITRIPV